MTNDQTPTQSPPDHGPIGTPRSVPLTILLAIVTLSIWTWIWSYWNGEELKAYRRDGLGGLFYTLFTIFFVPITMFLMANEVEKMYQEAGERPKITTLWGLWFLLPFIGQIVWYIGIQNAINEFWQARGATMSPGVT
jgi:hypothetical protein